MRSLIMMKVDEEKFKNILIKIQSERAEKDLKNNGKIVSYEKLTRAIANMIEANPNIFDRLVEVEIDGY